MTVVSSTYFTDWLAGDGVETEWPYNFPIPDTDSVRVLVKNALGEITVFDSGFKLTAYTPSSGVVEFPTSGTLVPPGSSVRILRDTALTQERAIGNEGAFHPVIHETALDKLTYIAIEQQEQIDRSLKSPMDARLDRQVEDIPEGHVWVADADGNMKDGGDASGLSTDAADAAASAAAAQTSANNAATQATLASAYRNEALVAKGAAENAQGLSEAAAGLAERWASENENVPVEGGEYSAKHWAMKAEGVVSGTIQSVPNKATLKLLSPDSFSIAIVNTTFEEYIWVAGDFSALVDADTGEGIYIQSSILGFDKTQGAWVRKAFHDSGTFMIEWFEPDAGMTGVGVSAAFVAIGEIMEVFAETNGAFGAGSLEIVAKGAPHAYYVDDPVVFDRLVDAVALRGPAGRGAMFYTDQDILMFDAGDYKGTADIQPTPNRIFHFTMENIYLRNLDPDSHAQAVRVNHASITSFFNLYTSDFYITLDFFRSSTPAIWQCRFSSANRDTVGGLAHLRMQGNYDSLNAHTPGGGAHITDNEWIGSNADTGLQLNMILMHACDGCYRLNNHYVRCMYAVTIDIGGGIDPGINKSVTDIHAFGEYYDEPGLGGTNVRIMGEVQAAGMLQDITHHGCLFRGANAADHGLTFSVTDSGDFVSSGDEVKNIILDTCRFRQHRVRGVTINGPINNPDIVPVHGFKCLGVLFEFGNVAGGSPASDLTFNGHSISMIGCTHRKQSIAASRLIVLNLVEGGSALIESPDLSEASWTELDPVSAGGSHKSANIKIDYGLPPATGRRMSTGVVRKHTSGNQVAVLRSFALSEVNTIVEFNVKVWGIATNNYAAYELRAVARRDNAGTTTELVSQVIRQLETITNISQAVHLKILTGPAWASGATATVGNTVTAGGRCYIVVEPGSGTFGAVAPSHTNGTSQTDSNGVRYADCGVIAANTLALLVTGGGTAEIDWDADFSEIISILN